MPAKTIRIVLLGDVIWARVAIERSSGRLSRPLTERHLVIFLEFTRRNGHPHPHLQDAINNYSRLLVQMGHSEEQVAARLKRLAPEIFDSTPNQPKAQ